MDSAEGCKLSAYRAGQVLQMREEGMVRTEENQTVPSAASLCLNPPAGPSGPGLCVLQAKPESGLM